MSATTGSYRALEMAVQEAEVYAEYLKARWNQAKEAADVAIADQARGPGDSAKATLAKGANADLIEAKNEYDEQMALVVKLRKETAGARTLAVKAEQTAWTRAEKRVKTRESVVKEPRTKTVKTRAIQHKDVRPKKRVEFVQPGANNVQPPPAMRKKMAHKAELATNKIKRTKQILGNKIADAAKALKEFTAGTEAPDQSNNKAANAERAAPRVVGRQAAKVPPAGKECPNCTARVPYEAKECKCGYGFSSGAKSMPEIGLSKEDRESFNNLLHPTQNR